MSKVFMTKRKTAVAAVAIVMSALIILSGTFAWQSISQTALNEVSGTVNPGGRLHDDFNDVTEAGDLTRRYNKDVYVENFTTLVDNGVQIFARIRLYEYMEFGVGAGGLNADGTAPSESNKANSLVAGAKLEDKSSWSIYKFNEDSEFRDYWTWDFEGKTVYMPTFNKNKDSLQADINGTSKKAFNDYTEYTVGDSKLGTAVYDADTNIEDEVGDSTDYETFVSSNNITIEAETHTAKETIDGYVISMADWINGGSLPGDYWVYDTDGWAYWANPINPDSATGLLLDGIQRTDEIINEDWYYAINVVAQFITKDDIGYDNRTGFYSNGETVSNDALELLRKIGVEVTFEVDTAEKLQEALARGGNIVLTKDVTVDTNLIVTENTVLDLGEHTISVSADAEGIYDEDNSVWSLISVQGADTTLTINGGNFEAKANDSFAVDVRDGAELIINDGNFVGNISAVYVHTGSALINGGTFRLNEISGESTYDQMIKAYDVNYANGAAKITICGGSFHNFDPTAVNDGNFVPDGFEVSSTDEGVYTVKRSIVIAE